MILDVPVESLGSTALVEWSQELEDLLTVKDRFGETYTLHKHSVGQKYAVVPRGLINKTMVKYDHRVSRPVSQLIAAKPPRNEDQTNCIAKSLGLLQHDVDHIVEAPTGFGKTFLGAAVAIGMCQATLIVVTKNDLTVSWRDTLIHLMGVKPSEIGHIQQDIQDYKGKRFVIAMVHSLICREYDPEMYSHFGLVIFDECHRLGSDHFVQVCEKFPAKSRLGLSATPQRGDGRERLFHAHIGPTLVRGTWIPLNPKILVKDTPWKPPMVNRRDETGKWKHLPMEVVPGRMMNINKAIASDVARNEEIALFVRTAYDKGRTTLVVSDLIDDHLRPLFHYFVAAGVPATEIGYYIGGMKQHELDLTKKKRVVLATYLMVSEGTDVPHWDTLVLATPRANIKQVMGRILRFVPDKLTPTILDLVDDDPTLKNFHYSRLRQYYSVNAEVIKV